jgi:transcriptional regulator with XRE-family HTH domain
MVTDGQLRAARALLGWSQNKLAIFSGLSKPLIARFELSMAPIDTHGESRDKLIVALEAAGVEFLNGSYPGVKIRGGGMVTKLAVDAAV